MRNSLNAVVFGAIIMFSAGLQAEVHQHEAMSAASESASQQVITGTGIVKDIDLTNKKVTISHEAIPEIGWPAMTMRFTFIQVDASITALTVGSHVNFSFVQQGNLSLLKSIK
ncbi:Cation efflux system protein CusF [Enterobacter cloacae]|uniref:cation efflux system protein CusF n=1 Tax=Enterobacter roggenkampii TaxID=1812935 RepID=UPI00061538B3|nr:cation efflux system protein CusF [Enterobacter roggenkampii]KKA56483.1 copper ABC transporter substrate-binding protein [Enterobacter roggenkampii]CAF9421162.1 Cation efflux system protein CusF [Enterobacter cloacae]CAH5876786.1 Cation efflux system protein CusF [Enterobacter cloacae]CAH5899782.1 Cation efflux system protein CusF [Enterobacter cloacae]